MKRCLTECCFKVLFPVIWIAYRFCDWKARSWFRRPHPFWDRATGKPQSWSVKKYGDRPQTHFYQTWESRRQWFAKRCCIESVRIDDAERAAVREQYGINQQAAAHSE